jgi:hypothetical protein
MDNQIAKCPVCNTDDFIEFTFVSHHSKGRISKNNPSDYEAIYICEKSHFFDGEGVLPEVK